MKDQLTQIIKTAGAYILKRYHEDFKIMEKSGINNLVTEVDLATEELIKNQIKEYYPDHGFIGEEYGDENENATFKWIIDPIDGTINYAHGIPLYCVSIAVAKDNEVILGAIFNPATDEFFIAEKDNGAYCNGKKMQVSTNENLAKSFLVTGFPYQFPDKKVITDTFASLVTQGIPVRRLGSAALDLAYVADGRFDGFWEYNLNAWDIAAGYLLVQEAGGVVTNFNNEKGHFSHQQTLATNGYIHQQLLTRINP